MNPQARLGAFVLIALILLFFATGKIGGSSWFKDEGRIVETEFNDLMGLDIESPVRMAGVKVGTVKNIFLRNNRAVVRIALKPGVQLPASTRASIISRGLVGEKNLALTAQPGDTSPLPKGQIIPSDLSGDINTFVAKASEITDDIRSLTKALSGDLGNKNSPASLHHLIENFNHTSEELSAIIEENRKDVHATATSMRHTMQVLEKELPELVRQLRHTTSEVSAIVDRHRTNIDRFASELPETVHAGKEFFKQGKELTDNLNASVIDNRENLYRILFELRKTSENLEAFSDDIRRNPWKVLSKEPEIKAPPAAKRAKMEEMILTTGHMGPASADQP
jgi:virulence factor Mce-like protein